MSPIAVMGASGAGKSSIGLLLAAQLHREFIDADDLHSAANVATMAAGRPLTDDDRYPWLAQVGRVLEQGGDGVVVACSALRRDYRDRIRLVAPATTFVHLEGTREVLAARMARRSAHFMPGSLLDSQLATLEPLDADEAGFAVSIEPSPAQIVSAIIVRLGGGL